MDFKSPSLQEIKASVRSLISIKKTGYLPVFFCSFFDPFCGTGAFNILRNASSNGTCGISFVFSLLSDSECFFMIYIFADESCKDTHKYLVLGALCIEVKELDTTLKLLMQVRDTHKTYGEVKWGKVSRSKLNFYKEFVDVFFTLAKTDTLHFHSLIVDTSTFNHRKFNQSDHEIGFNKLIFQLLLHKFGRKYGSKYRLYAHLDERTTKHSPEEMRPMLNACLKRDWRIPNHPFKRLTFLNSKESDVLQLNDLLIGAIGFRKNKHHQAKDASPHKIELASYIAEGVMKVQDARPTSKDAVKFTMWDFKYKDGVLRA